MTRLFAFAFAAFFVVLLAVPAVAQSRLDAGRSKAHMTCSERCQQKFTEAKQKQVCMARCKAAGKR